MDPLMAHMAYMSIHTEKYVTPAAGKWKEEQYSVWAESAIRNRFEQLLVYFCGARFLFLRWHGATWGVRGASRSSAGCPNMGRRHQLTASCGCRE